MDIIYYYSEHCGSCKDYVITVDNVSKALNISLMKIDIDIPMKQKYKLGGVPCLIVEEDGVEIYRSLGNLNEKQLMKDIKGLIKDDK